jgi:hypothetical protein
MALTMIFLHRPLVAKIKKGITTQDIYMALVRHINYPSATNFYCLMNVFEEESFDLSCALGKITMFPPSRGDVKLKMKPRGKDEVIIEGTIIEAESVGMMPHEICVIKMTCDKNDVGEENR